MTSMRPISVVRENHGRGDQVAREREMEGGKRKKDGEGGRRKDQRTKILLFLSIFNQILNILTENVSRITLFLEQVLPLFAKEYNSICIFVRVKV